MLKVFNNIDEYSQEYLEIVVVGQSMPKGSYQLSMVSWQNVEPRST